MLNERSIPSIVPVPAPLGSDARAHRPSDAARATRAPVRIAVVSDAVPERNGVGSYYRDLVEQLRDRVESVEMICPDVDPRPDQRPICRMPGDDTQWLSMPRVRRLARRLRELSPDVVIVPTPGFYGVLGFHLARRSGAQVVVGFHTRFEQLIEMYWRRSPLAGVGRVVRWYLEACNRFFFRNGSIVLANSRQMVSFARSNGAREVRLVGTPLPLPFLSRPVAPLPDRLGSVLFAGRLAREKNVDSLIAAARALPGMRFHIAGDGPEGERVRQAAERIPNLTWLGWLSREEVMGAMDAVDAVVLPSQVEAFGTVALEAMARGRVVLVSGQCGILEWPELEKGLFRIGGDETLADALARVAALDPDLRRERAEVARRTAKELSDWNLDDWVDTLAAGQKARRGGRPFVGRRRG